MNTTPLCFAICLRFYGKFAKIRLCFNGQSIFYDDNLDKTPNWNCGKKAIYENIDSIE